MKRHVHYSVVYLKITDRQVFLLYTALAGAAGLQGSHGLGSVDSRNDYLSVDVDDKLTIELAQDTSSLRSRKGDTGSVLWRARCVPKIR
jgi:hypothetical protein